MILALFRKMLQEKLHFSLQKLDMQHISLSFSSQLLKFSKPLQQIALLRIN